MKRKFRAIQEPVDVPRESKIRKQAYSIGLLNDFVSWIGMKPAETSESKRQVEAGESTITVFKNRPQWGLPSVAGKSSVSCHAMVQRLACCIPCHNGGQYRPGKRK